jgi:hypothetical protein
MTTGLWILVALHTVSHGRIDAALVKGAFESQNQCKAEILSQANAGGADPHTWKMNCVRTEIVPHSGSLD